MGVPVYIYTHIYRKYSMLNINNDECNIIVLNLNIE